MTRSSATVGPRVADDRWRIGRWARPRPIHPGAWWGWALGMAAAASRTNNPLLLGLLISVAALVVSSRRPDAPWARSFGFFVRLGVLIVVVRILAQLAFGASVGSTMLLPLPGLALPEWMAGARLGGDIMMESVLLAAFDGLRLATILICIGAANALASPSRLLKALPAALYQVGVSVVIAMTFAPQLVADVARVQTARRLRGRPTTGPRAIAGATGPVVESALERSVTLAAAMDARGYGRTLTEVPTRHRLTHHRRTDPRTTSAMLLAGLVFAAIGSYGLVADGSPWVLQAPVLALGLACCLVSLRLAGRDNPRTTYRPDPWWLPEWVVLASGVIVAIAFTATGWWLPGSLTVPVDPPTWPELPLLPLLGITVAALPSVSAPPLPESLRPAHRTRAPERAEPRLEVAA